MESAMRKISLAVVLSLFCFVNCEAEITRYGTKAVVQTYHLPAQIEVKGDAGSKKVLTGHIERFSFSFLFPVTGGLVAAGICATQLALKGWMPQIDWPTMGLAFAASETMVLAFNCWGGPIRFIRDGHGEIDAVGLSVGPFRPRFISLLSAKSNQKQEEGVGRFAAYSAVKLNLVVDPMFKVQSAELVARGIAPRYADAAEGELVTLPLQDLTAAERARQVKWSKPKR